MLCFWRNAKAVIVASKPKQSIGAAKQKAGLLRRLAPRNDDAPIFKCAFAFSRREAPEPCMKHFAQENRARRESRVLAAPGASRAKVMKHTRVVTTG
jgi:hypothetical protein